MWFSLVFFFLMIRRPPRSTRTDTLLPYPTLFRSQFRAQVAPLGQQSMFRLRPDLVVRNSTGVVAVGDTKWSLVTSDARGWLAPDEAHAYQMYAYSSAFPCRDLYLIYPSHAVARKSFV